MICKLSIALLLVVTLVGCTPSQAPVARGETSEVSGEHPCECIEFSAPPFEASQIVSTPSLAGQWVDQFGIHYEVTRLRDGVYRFRGEGEPESQPFFPPEQTYSKVGEFHFLFAPRMEANDCGSLALVRSEGERLFIRYFDPGGLASELAAHPGGVHFKTQPGARRGCVYVVQAPTRETTEFLRSMGSRIEDFGIDQEFQLVRVPASKAPAN